MNDYRGKPEMNVASNGTQVGQVTSKTFTVWDLNGTRLATTTMAAMVTNAGLNPTTSSGNTPYEPHVVFNPFINRWIISVTCSLDCILVSSGTDAVTSTWNGFYLDNQGADESIHLSYDKNGVYFTEVVLGDPVSADTPYGSRVYAVPASELAWSGTSALNPAHRNRMLSKPLDTMPVIDANPSKAANAPAFFVARTCSGANCQNQTTGNYAFQWIVISGTWSGTTFTWTSSHTSLCAGGTAPADQCLHTNTGSTADLWLYNTPLDPPQPGTTVPLRGVEIHRILGAMQQGNDIHLVLGSGACKSGCGNHGVDTSNIAIWADLDCSTASACVVHQTQKISTANHLLWPVLGVDATGNVGIFANVVNATNVYLGIQAWSHKAADPLGQLSAPQPVVSGTTSYLCSLQPTDSQTGNPVGVSATPDPLDPTTIWVTDQYANSTTDCHWSTRIVQFRP